MRLFIAIEPDEAAIRHLQRMQNALRDLINARWTPAEQLHLTLKFLGDTPDERILELLNALQTVHLTDPIRLQISGIVCFPSHGSVRIIAAAMEDEENRCAALAAEIDKVCRTVGYPLEPRRWTPHITLARVKERTPPEMRQRIAAVTFPAREFTVDQFVLKESRLNNRGASYSTLATLS
jgi:2'-5' RNA ligase